MDTLFINGLMLETTIGAYDFEKQIKQKIMLDIAIDYDSQPAAKSDNLNDALDYDALCQGIIETAKNQSFALIESLGNHIANFLVQTTQRPITLTLYKNRAVKKAQNIALKLSRTPA